jgi:hypothetical protein
MRVFVEGVGLLGPGLAGWPAGRTVLKGEAPYRPAATAVKPSELLPPVERRRTGVPVKLALAVGQEALAHAGCNAAVTATVFTSSGGDGDNVHQLCETLASSEREVSPTRFHNSVHNAAAGYWSIATHCHEASTSLCCRDASFAAGLLEAAAQIAVDGAPVALIAYDQPYPEPLGAVRPIGANFGVALVLAREKGRAAAALDVTFSPGRGSATIMTDAALEALRSSVPAARSLPLLAALARNTGEDVVLEYLEAAHLKIMVAPCS